MEIHIDDDTDEEIAQAIATAVSEHLGRGVELVGEGGTLAEAGENWSEEGAVVTERESAVRERAALADQLDAPPQVLGNGRGDGLCDLLVGLVVDLYLHSVSWKLTGGLEFPSVACAVIYQRSV